MIVMFGDHQAAVETEFYEELYGKALKELTAKESDLQYITPLVIWTNYEIEEKEIDRISSNYLGSMILELANLELTPYNEFLLSAWEQVPVLGKNGCYLADGSYVPWSSKESWPDILHSYCLLEYNYVADRSDRLDSLFLIDE